MATTTKRQRAPTQSARTNILDAAAALLRERRGGSVTTDEVATRAGCAKGLVHYHFRTKAELLAAAATRLWDDRARSWTQALGAPDPRHSIGTAWELLRSEVASGAAAACTAMGMHDNALVVQSVNTSRATFGQTVTSALDSLLERMGLAATVPTSELGTLLMAIIDGVGLQLGGGVDPEELEQAWAAFWVGLLSLTRSGGR